MDVEKKIEKYYKCLNHIIATLITSLTNQAAADLYKDKMLPKGHGE